MARRLARAGVDHLVLISRRGPAAPGAADLVGELRDAGTRVTVAACDVADREALARVVAEVEAGGEAVRSVFHTAGVAHIRALAELSPAELADATRAKTAGAANLDALFGADGRDPLDAFVLFSSGAGTWGGARHGAYAAGNAFLDALAAQRRGRGLPATAIAWGDWARRRRDDHAARRGHPPRRPAVHGPAAGPGRPVAGARRRRDEPRDRGRGLAAVRPAVHRGPAGARCWTASPRPCRRWMPTPSRPPPTAAARLRRCVTGCCR